LAFKKIKAAVIALSIDRRAESFASGGSMTLAEFPLGAATLRGFSYSMTNAPAVRSLATAT
jgi:hypothetical protein